MIKIDHMQDGITHLCVGPNGKTPLGRLLHIGAHRPFVDPQCGFFASIVAFWVWFDSGRNDALREIHHGNMIRSSMCGLPDLAGNRQEVIQVLKRSIVQDVALADQLSKTTLPLLTYETIAYEGRSEPVSYPLPDREWYTGALEQIRTDLQARS